MRLGVCVSGATGWIGEPLAAAIASSDDMELVAAVSRQGEGQCVHGLRIQGTLQQALAEPSHVVVDFTSIDSVKANIATAMAAGRHVVVGTTGLTDRDFEDLDQAARVRGVGVIAVASFAMTAMLLERFALEAARALSAWEIVELAALSATETPSAFARELAWRLGQEAPPPSRAQADADAEPPVSRGAALHRTRVHSVRLPGHGSGLEIMLGGPDERLTIRYETGHSPTPFVEGAMRAIRHVPSIVGLKRGIFW